MTWSAVVATWGALPHTVAATTRIITSLRFTFHIFPLLPNGWALWGFVRFMMIVMSTVDPKFQPNVIGKRLRLLPSCCIWDQPFYFKTSQHALKHSGVKLPSCRSSCGIFCQIKMTGAWLFQKKLHHLSETRPTAAIVGMVWSSKSRNIRNGHRQLSDHDGHINPYVVGLIFRLIFPSTLGHLHLYNSVESTGTFVGIDRKKTSVSNKPTNPTDHWTIPHLSSSSFSSRRSSEQSLQDIALPLKQRN